MPSELKKKDFISLQLMVDILVEDLHQDSGRDANELIYEAGQVGMLEVNLVVRGKQIPTYNITTLGSAFATQVVYPGHVYDYSTLSCSCGCSAKDPCGRKDCVHCNSDLYKQSVEAYTSGRYKQEIKPVEFGPDGPTSQDNQNGILDSLIETLGIKEISVIDKDGTIKKITQAEANKLLLNSDKDIVFPRPNGDGKETVH